MHPETFLRVLGPEPWRVAYVQPSRRPADGRYGENPNRLYKHHQFQVILKPAPADVQDLYLGSLRRARHRSRRPRRALRGGQLGVADARAPGASAGRCCSTARRSRSSRTSSRRAASTSRPISAEITYGLERIAMYLQDVDDVYDAARGRPDVPLRRRAPGGGVPALALLVRAGRRRAAPAALRQRARRGLARARSCRAAARVLRRLRLVPEGSHAFNVLDARGAISVSQRAGMILGIRKLACAIAAAYVAPPAEPRRRAPGRPRA